MVERQRHEVRKAISNGNQVEISSLVVYIPVFEEFRNSDDSQKTINAKIHKSSRRNAGKSIGVYIEIPDYDLVSS